MKNPDRPSRRESVWRRHVPSTSGVRRIRVARTGAPASARTALRPMVRINVLLPAMFEPLTINTRGLEPKVTVFRTATARGMSGCAISVAS